MNKESLFGTVEGYMPQLTALADDIFDHPEVGFEEHHACEVLTSFLEGKGFFVERGAGGLETAFRAEWEFGKGGPVIGFLGEYDALAGLGHGCGHHLQTPAAIGAALALRDNFRECPFKLVIYGTPAEETRGGKITMAENGCFGELDLVFSNHTGGCTGGCGATMALGSSVVEWTGKAAHAGGSPEKGRSALDAMMLAFHGLECMREHIITGCRVHYTILEGTGATNIVHPKARARITMRAFNKIYLKEMLGRLENIIKGSCLMTETSYTIERDPVFDNIIWSQSLDKAVAENARLCGAPRVSEHTLSELTNPEGGASDYGNVSWKAPGILLNVMYSDAPGHTPTYVACGKTPAARDYIKYCSDIMAGVSCDFLTDEDFRRQVREEYERNLAKCSE